MNTDVTKQLKEGRVTSAVAWLWRDKPCAPWLAFRERRAGDLPILTFIVHPWQNLNMKAISIVAAVCLGLLAGCASQRHAEKFGISPKLEVNDDFKIEMAVYGYLLEKHPWGDNGEYTAIFLAGSDDRVAALIKKFPKQVPPLKPGDRVQRSPNQAPIDKDTGKPGMFLNAKAVDQTNGVSEAVGTWYAGGSVSGLCAFVLVKVDGEWTIQSVK
jgi:hypothetical protein